jgi:two-component system cell cycle response regulator DivK
LPVSLSGNHRLVYTKPNHYSVFGRLGIRAFESGLECGPRNQMDYRQTHILIVDDSADDRSMYTHYLTRRGYRVSKAHDGKEGLEKAFWLVPDLILLDLWLPKISGWEVMQHLKANERTRQIPILVISGNTPVQPLECDGFLTKPCHLDQLGAEIAHRVSAPAPTSPRPPVV